MFDHGGGIVKSDSSVKTALNEKLRECVHKLEEISEDKKDGHRDSGESALDLLDPSLYALFYGRTKALPAETIGLENCLFYMGKGRVVGVGENESDGDTSKLAAAWMNGFNHFDNRLPEFWGSCHWLPSEIKLLGEGVKITSYINNLHPVRHKELYAVLEQLVSTVVPLWEECLSTCGQWRVGRGHANFNDFEVPEEGVLYRIPGRESPDCWVDPWESWEGDEEPDWQDDAFEEWTKSGQFLLWPEPGTPRTQEMLLPRERGAGFEEKFPRGLQVIFKLANILLTPDHPSYAGGEWQVEGALNDMICASAIYYYDCANITDGRIAFRHLIDNFSTACEEGEFCGYEAIMGFGREDPRLQELGQVSTPEGRVLVFPNRFQHKVEPFRLRDATRPGHRKILAMFLVDPHRPILSTANVPPQQGDWYFERLMSLEPFASLPDEVNLLILENLDCRGWKSWEEALEGRRKLMGERWRLNDELLGYVEEVCPCFHLARNSTTLTDFPASIQFQIEKKFDTLTRNHLFLEPTRVSPNAAW